MQMLQAPMESASRSVLILVKEFGKCVKFVDEVETSSQSVCTTDAFAVMRAAQRRIDAAW